MTLKTSLIITGDASVAKKEVDSLKASVASLASGAKSAAAPIAQVNQAQEQAAGSARQAATATAQYVAANDQAAASSAAAAKQLAGIRAAQATAATAATAHATAAQGLQSELTTMIAQIAGGSSVFQAMADRGGAFAEALAAAAQASAGVGQSSEQAGVDLGGLGDTVLDVAGKAEGMEGKLGSAAAFLGGPWGAAIGLGINLLGGFVAGLIESDGAADQAAEGAANLARYVDDLGNFFDATTGKIIQTNAALRENAALAAIKRGQTAADRIADAKERGADLIRGSARSRLEGGGSYSGGGYTGQMAPGSRDIMDIFASGKDVDAKLRKLATSKSDNADSAAEILRLRGEIAQARGDIGQAKKDLADIERGYRAPARVADRSTDRGSAASYTKHVATGHGPARDNGADIAQKAADDAAKAQQRALDQVIAKYLPATAAAKDYADELARINALAASYDGKTATSGLTAEQANAARAALKAANDARVAALNLTPEAKAAADAKKSIDGVIASLGQELAVRQAANPVEAAMIAHRQKLADLAKTDPGAAAAREAELRAAVAQNAAYRGVEEATRAAAEAQRQFRDMALDAFDAIVLGGENAGKVIDRLGQTIASAAIEAAVLGTGPLAALLKGGVAAGSGAGTPPVAPSAGGAAAQATADVLGRTVSKSIGDRLDSVFGKGNGGKVLQSAGFGYTAASLTGGNGIGGSLGGALGGQIAGKFLTGALGSVAGPLGSIVGGVLGGVVGKLFAAAPKYGTASVTGDSVGVSGNGGAAKAAANSLAGAVQSGVAQIAEKLGGELGKYAVSIGTFDGKYRVSTTGFTGSLDSKKAKGQGLVDFGKEGEGAAIAYAIADAVKDGAVKGLSAAVTKAIQSSTDINAALAEALKVQDLELLVGGVNAQIDKTFRDFETQAKERVRLATTYGFDLVAIEKRNGEDRVKLAQQLATQQVGSLQKLIGEITQGSLFEGSALDRITALNTAIAKARTDLDAGVEGAADTLADLYQKRLAASKEAYGGTSGYAADRTATLDAARAAVAAANARIVAAQSKPSSDPALSVTNAALDENNDQNARMIGAIEAGFDRLSAQIAAGRSPSFDLLALART